MQVKKHSFRFVVQFANEWVLICKVSMSWTYSTILATGTCDEILTRRRPLFSTIPVPRELGDSLSADRGWLLLRTLIWVKQSRREVTASRIVAEVKHRLWIINM